MKKILCAATLAAAMLHIQPALAECRKIDPATDQTEWVSQNLTVGPLVPYSERSVSFGDSVIDVDPNLGIGETIVSGTTASEGGLYFIVCEGASGTIRYDMARGDTSLSEKIFPTGTPGVAYRVIYKRASGTTVTFPDTNNFVKQGDAPLSFISLAAGATFLVDLIKTGEMGSLSSISLGSVGKVVAGGDGQTVMLINSDPVTLRVLPHCWVASDKSMLVDFGPFGPKEVSTTSGPTKPVTIDVACDGPTAPNSITATLNALPDDDEPRYIKNKGDAKNLAIRLRDISTQTLLRPLDSTSSVIKANPGFAATFNLEASVLRVGSVTPSPGSIDAQAIVTLTFL